MAWTAWRGLVGAGGDPALVRRALKTPYDAASQPVTARPRGLHAGAPGVVHPRPARLATGRRPLRTLRPAARGHRRQPGVGGLRRPGRPAARHPGGREADPPPGPRRRPTRVERQGVRLLRGTPTSGPRPATPARTGAAPWPGPSATHGRRTASTPRTRCRPRYATRSPRRPSSSSPTRTTWTPCCAPWTPSAAPRA
ncbi:hypothetical protein LT493_31980 [Streptomyces tricolor]|nr:hypothetical protein [Streptomyces tricolor]